MPEIPVKNCCGCTACYNACKSGAIKMRPSDEGFLYPEVIKALCVNCGRCESVCPVNHPPLLNEEYIGYVTQSQDDGLLSQSTSGGFMDALYKYVLDDLGGLAAGVAFDKCFLPKHIIVDSYDAAKAFRNSKYAQSDLGDVFSQIKKLLSDGKTVLFVGTPCQVGGLKAFLYKEYDNLITADLVCRSVPSPLLWRKYLDFQESRYRSKVRSAAFRKKTYGYHSGTLEIVFENGKRYNGSNRVDYYMKAFHGDKCSRRSCYSCDFKTEHRCSDFTVFDCWRPEQVSNCTKDNDKGFSNVIIHSNKGKEIFENLKNINCFEADVQKMFCFTGGMESASISYTEDREHFYSDLENLGFEKGVKKHVKVTVKDRLIESAKPLRYHIKGLLKK